MFSAVSLPLWVVLLLVGLALWSVLDHLLVPSVRWMLRKRANKAIDELNTRLSLKIQPFKLTKRKVLTEKILYDPEVLSAIDSYAETENMPRDVAMQKAKRYAKDIVPAFSAYTYFKIGAKLAKWVSTSLYRIRLGYMDSERLSKVDSNASVVFVMNHRSNMDYILVTYLVATNSALSYAVGEWAKVWPIRGLIKSMGAYFVRRNSNNPLYRRVLAKYVDMSTKAGVVQGVFPEGGLTKDGKLQKPKLGLLSYIVADFNSQGERDVVFVPVGINYDRVPEDRIQTSSLTNKDDKVLRKRFTTNFLSRYFLNSLWLRLRGRWFRYGYACVSFGSPISLTEYLKHKEIDFRNLETSKKFQEIDILSQHLMEAVGKVVPALPVSLICLALLRAGNGTFTSFEIKGKTFDLIEEIRRNGAHVHIPREDQEYAVEVGLRMLTLRKLVIKEDDLYHINPKETVLLNYYANSIKHLIEDHVIASASS